MMAEPKFSRAALLIGAFLFFYSCNSVNRYIHDDSVLVWENDIAAFDSLNAVEPSGPETVLVTGSSSIRLWDSIHTDMEPYQVMQRGYGGARLSDFDYYADRIIKPGKFNAIVVFVANDISGGEDDRTPGEVFALYKNLVDQVHERNRGTPMFWIQVTPTPSRWGAWPEIEKANEKIRKYTEKNPGLYFIQTADAFLNAAGRPDSIWFRDDMLHLNREGYKKWRKIIKGSLRDAGIKPSA